MNFKDKDQQFIDDVTTCVMQLDRQLQDLNFQQEESRKRIMQQFVCCMSEFEKAFDDAEQRFLLRKGRNT